MRTMLEWLTMESTHDLRIVSINTWKCDGDYFRRRDVLARALVRLRPDVVALQESFATVDREIDTARYLAAALGMGSVFLPMRRKIRELEGNRLDSFSGQAVLCRGSIESEETIELPSTPEDGGRSAQITRLRAAAGTRLLLANLHLSFVPEAADLREEQLAIVLAHPSVADAGGDLRVVCGDFNATLDAPELAPFLAPPYALRDTYSLAKGSSRKPGTMPSFDGPDARAIDHIFVLPDGQGAYAAVHHADIVLCGPEAATGLHPSDHCGVLADVATN